MTTFATSLSSLFLFVTLSPNLWHRLSCSVQKGRLASMAIIEALLCGCMVALFLNMEQGILSQVVLFIYVAACSLDHAYLCAFGTTIDGYALSFIVDNYRSSMRLAKGARPSIHALIPFFVICPSILTILNKRYGHLPLSMNSILCIVAILMAILIYMSRRLDVMPPVVNLTAAMIGGLLFRSRELPRRHGGGLSERSRWEVPMVAVRRDSRNPNILLVVAESMSTASTSNVVKHLSTPRYNSFINKMEGMIFQADRAISNSAASDVSYPSIFSGLSPEESHDAFHKAPLLWSLAKARGYSTGLYTS